MVLANYIAFTAPINPPGASPQLTADQVWVILQRKVSHAEEFVGAIVNTEIVSESKNVHGLPVTVRVVTFREGDRRVVEECTFLYPTTVEFRQPEGSKVLNIVSKGAEGELYLTYTFEWVHPEVASDESALAEKRGKEEAMAKAAVESTIKAMRMMRSMVC